MPLYITINAQHRKQVVAQPYMGIEVIGQVIAVMRRQPLVQGQGLGAIAGLPDDSANGLTTM